MALLPIETLVTGAAAWLLADCRHGRATRVQLDVVGGRRLRVASDGEITAKPLHPEASLDMMLTQRSWSFSDGRVDWPDLLEACSDWELVLRAKKGSLVIEGSHGRILSRKESPKVEPGARFTFAPDSVRTSGSFATPQCLAALHAQAGKWPDAKYIVRLPGAERWSAARD